MKPHVALITLAVAFFDVQPGHKPARDTAWAMIAGSAPPKGTAP